MQKTIMLIICPKALTSRGICGRIAETPRELDIHGSKYNIDGAGQLCRGCYLAFSLENKSFREGLHFCICV